MGLILRTQTHDALGPFLSTFQAPTCLILKMTLGRVDHFIPVLELGKLRHQEVNNSVQGCVAASGGAGIHVSGGWLWNPYSSHSALGCCVMPLHLSLYSPLRDGIIVPI